MTGVSLFSGGGLADAGLAIVGWVKAIRPRFIFVENVPGYVKHPVFLALLKALWDMKYRTDFRVLNAADYAVPQTRKRLILRAVLDGSVAPLPAPTPWLGWYQAVEDLIPTFPESEFAPWQLRRLPGGLFETVLVSSDVGRGGKAYVVEPDAAGERPPTVRGGDEPCYTLKASGGGRVHRAFLVYAENAGRKGPIHKDGEDPAFTVTRRGGLGCRAFLVGGGSAGKNVPVAMGDEPSITVKANSGGKEPRRAWLEQGRVLALTPRAIARFQTVPDDYELPAKKTLAGTIIGNGVPCEMVRRIVAATVEVRL